jgi:hypothetical protein
MDTLQAAAKLFSIGEDFWIETTEAKDFDAALLLAAAMHIDEISERG